MNSVSLPSSLPPRVRHHVQGHAGTRLAVQEWGNPDGTPIVFLHAFGTNHLLWQAQLSDPDLQQHRLVTFDHRGHGESERPETSNAYDRGEIWADDLHAVLTARGLRRPVLVGWSMSGALIGDYLAQHGTDRVGGLVFVAGVNRLGPAMFETQAGPLFAAPEAQGLFGAGLADLVPAWRFVNRGMTTGEASDDLSALMLASGMLLPLAARTAILPRAADYLPLLAHTSLPILAVHAADDRIVLPRAMDMLLEARPDTETHLWPTGSHAPQWENAHDFNGRLHRFVETVARSGNTPPAVGVRKPAGRRAVPAGAAA
jgi:non-heme chloroperoxidase